LSFISLSVFFESIKRLYEPPEIRTERLLMIAFGGFFVNLVGLFAFHDYRHASFSHDGHSHSNSNSHGHSHGKDEDQFKDDNMYGIFLHLAADTLGSLSVITSTILIWLYDFKRADPICSLIISILIGTSVIPLIKHSASILLQRTPQSLERKYDNCLQKLHEIPGVQEIGEAHFWTLTPGNKIGTINLQVEDDANEQKILPDATSIFKKYGIDNITIQINKSMSTVSNNFNWNAI